MLYHISGIDFDYFLFNYSTLFNKNDIIILDRSVLGRIDLKDKLVSKSQIKQLCIFSKNSETILVCATRILFGKNFYNSAIVIEYGNIVGVSSQITDSKGYNNGLYIDFYKLSFTSFILILNNDFYQQDIPMFTTLTESKYIIHLSCDKIDSKNIKVMPYLAKVTNAKAFDLYNDAAISFDNEGNISQIEIGTLRRFNTVTKLKHNTYRNSKFRIQKTQN